MADPASLERDWRVRRAANLTADDWVEPPDGTPVAHPPEATRRIEGLFEVGVPFEASQHPRGGHGRFRTTLGATPYHRLIDPAYPRPGFGDADTLHADRRYAEWEAAFRADTEALAKKAGVDVVSIEPNVGVFEGNFEPSFAVRVSGKDADVERMGDALGHRFGQDAVVGFRRDRKGADAEFRFDHVDDPDQLARALRVELGPDADASFDPDGSARIFVAGADPVVAAKLRLVSHRLGARGRLYRGRSFYLETGGGGGYNAPVFSGVRVHGTSPEAAAAINTGGFDLSKAHGDGELGPGIYFHGLAGVEDMYGSGLVWANIELSSPAPKEAISEIRQRVRSELGAHPDETAFRSRFLALLRERGYDGALTDPEGTVVVVYDPKAIKILPSGKLRS